MGLANLIKTELKLDLKQMLGYRASVISDLVIYAAAIISIFAVGLDGAFARAFGTDASSGTMLVLIGVVFWQISTTALGWCNGTIRGQMMTGSLELKMQSRYPVPLMIFIEMLTYLLLSFLSLMVFFVILMLFTGGSLREFYFIPLSYLTAIPGIVGMYGIGLIIGGFSLKVKETGNLAFILQTALAFVSDLIAVRSRAFNIIPFNAGIKIMRQLYLGWNVDKILFLDYAVVNILWLFVGLAAFNFFLKRERKYGSFDSY